MSVRSMKFVALCLGALTACDDGASTQVLTGRVDTTKGALAIRAVADNQVITATPVRTDGSFTLTLPAGSTYRLEVLTRTGVKNIVRRSGNVLRDLAFKVCQPVDPFDIGGVNDPSTAGLCMPGDPSCSPCDPTTNTSCDGQPPLPPTCDPMLDPNCACEIVAPDGTCCTPGDPSCGPLPCMDGTDPSCCDANGFCPPPPCDPNDPMCCYADGTCGEPPPPSCQPGEPNCCSPDAAGNCPPPPPDCDPMVDPNCKPPMPCSDPSDPGCGGGCGPMDPNCTTGCSDPTAPGCAPPCADPMDPTTCKDPCADDPASCGCMVDPSTGPTGPNDPAGNCWPEPHPCCDDGNGTTCDPTDGMAPDNVPGDFGCEGT